MIKIIVNIDFLKMENNYKHTAKITSCIKKIPSLSFFLPKTGVASYTIYSPPPFPGASPSQPTAPIWRTPGTASVKFGNTA